MGQRLMKVTSLRVSTISDRIQIKADGIIGNLTLSKMMEEWGNKI